MFDLLGSVFGRSKKSSSNKQENNQSEDDFVLVSEKQNDSGEKSSLYPFNKLPNEEGTAASSSGLSNKFVGYVQERSYSNPLDNVPFSHGVSVIQINFYAVELKDCFQMVKTVDNFLSIPSMSEYTFDLERSVLRETTTN